MSRKKNPRKGAEEFFYKNAGYSYDPKTQTEEEGRRETAKALAEAEEWAWDNNYSFSWSEEEEDWDTFLEGSKVDPHDVLEILALQMRNKDGTTVQSLGGVMFGHNAEANTRRGRVFEAELALEQQREVSDVAREANPMRKFSTREAARKYAGGEGMFYGFSTFSDGWYVGTRSELKDIGVVSPKRGESSGRALTGTEGNVLWPGDPGYEENPNRSDVIRAWEQGRKLKASGLRTEDGKLWSYALLIGETIDGKLVAYDYTGSNRVSPTTTTHVNAAKTAADEVRSAEGRPGRYGNPRTDNPGPTSAAMLVGRLKF